MATSNVVTTQGHLVWPPAQWSQPRTSSLATRRVDKRAIWIASQSERVKPLQDSTASVTPLIRYAVCHYLAQPQYRPKFGLCHEPCWESSSYILYMSHKKLFYLTHFSCHFDTRLTGTERLALWHVTPNKKFYVFQPYFPYFYFIPLDIFCCG